jgi:hypothetical protein
MEKEQQPATVLEWSFVSPPVSLEPEEREVIPFEPATPPVQKRKTFPVPAKEYIPFTPVQKRPTAVPSRYVPDDLDFVSWVAVTTWKVVKVATPLALVGVACYGVAVAFLWLISQPLFWVGLAVLGGGWYAVSSSFQLYRKETRKPLQRNGGDIITNVHIKGPVTGNVTTNIFIDLGE